MSHDLTRTLILYKHRVDVHALTELAFDRQLVDTHV